TAEGVVAVVEQRPQELTNSLFAVAALNPHEFAAKFLNGDLCQRFIARAVCQFIAPQGKADLLRTFLQLRLGYAVFIHILRPDGGWDVILHNRVDVPALVTYRKRAENGIE